MMTVADSRVSPCGHGPEIHPDGSATYRVWAPRAQQIDLVLFHEDESRTYPMQQVDNGWYQWTAEFGEDGQRYAFRIDGGPDRPDPASRWQPDGVHAPSALFRPEQFAWTDFGWTGKSLLELVIYELHIGTFTPEGTLDAAITRLPDLVELGISAIELMPVAQFPGSWGWGYDGVGLFAVQNSYGGPRALQRFVDAAHTLGLAVLLDVVYNHFGPEGNYLAEFGNYFTHKFKTPWGPALNYDDAESDPVRQFVLENVQYWLHDLHLDGLRLDAIQSIIDKSPTHILRDIQRIAEEVGSDDQRSVHVIAESNLNDVKIIQSPARGGYGLAGQWCDDFHHALHVLLTDEHDGYYVDFSEPDQLIKSFNDVFVYDGCYSGYRRRKHGAPIGGLPRQHFIVSVQNHDQIGNRALGDRLSVLIEPAKQRMSAAMLLLAPTTPLLFMGEEYGEQHPFPFFCNYGDENLIEAVRAGRRSEFIGFDWPEKIPDPQSEATFESAKLTWAWPAGSWQAGLRNFYRDLLAIRRRFLMSQEVAGRIATWHELDGVRQGVIELLRSDDVLPGAPRLAAYFNFSPQQVRLPDQSLVIRDQLNWYWLIRSESEKYGGERPAEAVAKAKPSEPLILSPYEVLIFGLVEGESP